MEEFQKEVGLNCNERTPPFKKPQKAHIFQNIILAFRNISNVQKFEIQTVWHSDVIPGLIGQLVTSLTADPGGVSSILARSHTFVENKHDIISMVILLLPLIQENCCQL